ncbi:enoyl-CoA hydratase [Agromyces terreus]|uniref:enoyl-CoA hydratase n=1 Tax=Agromyces terreus TaxID=424795 RepID=A0A9X2KDF7_9MICO|nr:enoyl-CoA hydratase-related protein [Agromyces terreus]MCP2372401.1 enoyl-CoA hydratase [Agromyces terreus]
MTAPETETAAPEVRLEFDDDAIAVVTIDRPRALNALSSDVLEAIDAAFDEIDAAAASVRGVLIVGAGGRAFVAGADISAMAGRTPAEGERMARLGHRVAARIEACRVPVIACVDGFALGGGLELALACDLVYATDASTFGQPEVRLGLIPGFGGTVRLPRVVGPARAKELIYTGRRIGIEEAVEAGLVARRFPDRDALLAGARETIALVAENSPSAIAAAKRVLVAAAGRPTDEAVELEIGGFMSAFGTDDMREGVAAFLEKRTPGFSRG